MSDTALVLTEHDDGIATLTINRPDKRNALSTAVRQAFLAAFQGALDDPSIRVIVVTGAGEKAFVAGADIAEFEARTPVEQFRAMRVPSPLDAIERSPKPVIAAINGYCLGGGLELAMACDFRVAAEHALFGQPEINLGIIPGGGGTQRLPRLVGLGHALRMILTGEPIDAAEALRIGLVQEVAADPLARAVALAEVIAAQAPLGVYATLASSRAALPAAERAAAERLLPDLRPIMTSADVQEGLRAFMERRPGNFRGK